MAALHIRDVPPSVIDALKRRAARNQRSLQKELVQILKRAAEMEPDTAALPPIVLRLSKAEATSSWRRDEIYGDGR